MSAMTVLLAIGGIGVLLLLVSLVVGDFLDGAFELGNDIFGGAALSGFLGALGFGGAIALGVFDNLAVAVVIGVVAGVLLGGGVGWLAAKLKQGGDESSVRTSDLTGREATVVGAIPAGGYGQVTLTVAGHLTRLNARSTSEVPTGTPVFITGVLSPTSVTVEPY